MPNSIPSRRAEVARKLALVRALLADHHLDALLLRRISSFAWLTAGGASYVPLAADVGASFALVTPDRALVLTSTIEAPRMEHEERVTDLGFELLAAPWYAPDENLPALTRRLRLAADTPYPGAVDLSAAVTALRATLGPEEAERFRALGALCGAAVGAAIQSVRPGQTETEIAGLLAAEVYRRGATPIVNLVAVDDRLTAYRHPLPTDLPLQKYALLVLCGRKWGLVASVTRLVHFGRLPHDLRRRADAVAQIDAVMIAATRPGASLAEVFAHTTDAYVRAGHPDEWRFHHQGGLTGYQPREVLATPSAAAIVALGQAYAWNPSVSGAKSEDTVLVGPAANEILTPTPGWPTLDVPTPLGILPRPAVLEIT